MAADLSDLSREMGGIAMFQERQIEMPHYLENIPEEELNSGSNMATSYESSIDIFPHGHHNLHIPHDNHDDHLSLDHPINFEDNHSHYSVSQNLSRPTSSVYKHNHPQAAPHQNLLIDDEDFDVHKQLTSEIELVFQNISHCIGTASTQRQILSEISGYACPGQVLAVMGPSGSGKTTLLNVLSGRAKPSTGDIVLNGIRINKQQRRRICYVLQQDIFFPSLTLKQTLVYTARLRLPQSMKDKEKLGIVDKLIEELHLKDCQNTVIGDVSQRGLSGGEKKRVNIACELLTNPSVMLIDEPTSGLDSCTAHNLVQTIQNYAVKRKKTIVMTVHQPSSQMFYMFDQLLLLSSGRLSYFGPINGVVPFFSGIGLTISLHYNPADFILEKVMNAVCQEKIIDAAKSLNKLPKYSDSEFKCSLSQEKGSSNCHSLDCWKKESLKSIELHELEDSPQQGYPKVPLHDSDSGRSSWSEPDRSSVLSGNSFCRDDIFSKIGSSHKNAHRKWPTSMWMQIKVLTERNFIEAKHRMLSKLNWIQTVALAIIAGLIWFQPERTEETIEDIRGWMFFTTTYWMLFGLFQALVSFPSERQVVNKERASGAYRLSSYYIAKMIGELPLTVALPSVFFFISYPMLGCTSYVAFLASWLFLVVSTIVSQSIGLFIGAACYDLEVSVTTSALYSLSTMLFAGYYTSMPPWLSWARYFSMVYYAFLNLQLVEFGSTSIECSKQASKFATCQMQANSSTPVNIPYSELELQLDLMNVNATPLPIWFNTLVLFGFLVFFRTLGYLVLRYGRKSAH